MESKRRIAIVGTAPSSRDLAPYKDPSWECWLMGPAWADEGNPMRWDRWFELHPVKVFDPEVTKSDPGYLEWLSKQDRPIYMDEPLDPRIPAAQAFPMERIHARHGGYFLDSTVAWMMAFIHDDFDVDEVGLWGIDFASNEERKAQKKGCFHFKYLLQEKGVTVTIPPESDMSFEPAPYPSESVLGAKLRVQIEQIAAQHKKTEGVIASLSGQLPDQEKHLARLAGYYEALQWMKEQA